MTDRQVLLARFGNELRVSQHFESIEDLITASNDAYHDQGADETALFIGSQDKLDQLLEAARGKDDGDGTSD